MKQMNILMPIVALVASSVFGQSTIVAPAGLENTEGNNALAIPITSGNARTQSLYEATNFAGPVIISKIAYRLDGNTFSAGASIDISDIQFKFSTFTGTTLSTTFAENIGSDEKVVFDRGSLHAVLIKRSPPNAFDLVVNLNNPFAYDPAAGGLLVDIMKFSNESVPVNLDAQTTSSVRTIYRNGVSINTGMTLDRVFVAQFTVVPEPSAASILFLGMCLPIYRNRAKRIRTLKHCSANP